ncbi:MAG: hypothetical protein MMC33_009235 [Icmadophila ericetorum]|nr:hypothetical protein [Icmadophila ericetorum]
MEPFTVHTSCLFDPERKEFLPNRSLTVDPTTGLITEVYHRQNDTDKLKPSDIDLRHLPVVLPGLIDAHTHVFLHPYSETSSTVQMRDESPVERIVRATNHVRRALLAGFTTYRDLGTESLGDSDAGLRDTINRGLIPGPRMYVATEALASSGGYEIRNENPKLNLPRASDVADGVDGVRAAVRRRIGAGADIIKVYADYRRRTMRFPAPITPCCDIQFPPKDARDIVPTEARNPNVLMYSQEEMDAIVAEANRANCPVAAHCGDNEAVKMAALAGVTSIEHGFMADEEILKILKLHGCIFVPTLAVIDLFVKDEKKMQAILKTIKRAWEMGVQLATGGDTGTFPHGENAKELELMIKAGIPLEEVLYAATIGGWKACGGVRCGRLFGWWEEGCAADIVGLVEDPRESKGALRAVDFVMKDGKVWKMDGSAVGMV